MPYFSTDDNCGIYYEEYGNKNGKPVVLVHGHGGNLHFFYRQKKALSEKYHLILFDLRGHGMSTVPKMNLTVPQLAADLNQLMEFLDLKDVALFGWSMGASVVLEYIRQYGCAALSHAGIIDNTAKMINDEDWEYGSFNNNQEALALIIEMAKGWKTYAHKYARIFFGEGDCPEEDVEWVEQEFTNNTNEAMLPLVISNITSDFTDVLPTITVPVLITYGTRKSFYDPKVSRGLAERIPNAQVKGFDGGHVHFIQDAEAFNAALIEFIEG